MGATQAKKQSNPPVQELDDDDVYTTRNPSSSILRYKKPAQHDTLDDPTTQPGIFIQRRRASISANTRPGGNGTASKAVTPPHPPSRLSGIGHLRKSKHFPWIALLLGMLAMGLLVVGLTTFGSWWRVHQDDMQYGRPRTFQLNAVVGHNDSPSNPTHFIFINLNRHVQIIELPGGDGTHAHVYTGPVLFGDGQDLTPVTAEVRDVNGDGKPDLIVHIQDQRFVLINTGTAFRPLRPGEQVNI